MTSRSCTKSYNRKVNSGISSGSIQFDKLFRENSNRPSAAKSAGTVGKWGITSFTSIRSTNLNGRRSGDSRINHVAKRIKLDYRNQNTKDKDIFCNIDKEGKSDMNKPKKFFKSRSNISVNDELSSDKGKYQSISQPLDKDTDKNSSFLNENPLIIKESDNNIDEVVEASFRDEGKPPIVLRICKGTSRLVCSESIDSESYRISAPLKLNIDHKNISQNVKSDFKSNRDDDYESLTSASGFDLTDKTEMRTTRSRSKNLHLDINKPTVTAIGNSQNSGLSLTLRKTLLDSKHALVSHYDIVKTENTSKSSHDQSESFLQCNQTLSTTTTQELINILSNDNELLQMSIEDNNVLRQEKVLNYTINKYTPEVDIQGSSIKNLEPSSTCEIDTFESQIIVEHHVERFEQVEDHKNLSPSKKDLLITQKDIKNPISKTFDQDWFSGSDDSECANSNLQNELQGESQCLINNTESSHDLENKTTNKPLIRKGSIFKTRSSGTTNENKRRALYKHKWCESDKELKLSNSDINRINVPSTSNLKVLDVNVETFDEELESAALTRITTYPDSGCDSHVDLDSAITSIRCDKKVKGFYTVVKNVKKAHQIQESGEFQEFNDDVEYILDTLRENNPNATRCLSAIRLASKCMAPAFRMHVRAHGTVAKFFKALHDATTDQSLALCTATVMFVLSQDRLAMDLDRDCLELMLSLLESDASHKNALNDCGLSHAELQKNKEKVRQLCADIQAHGHAKHLNLDNITVGQLAMETLLSLTSKRAGEWFKEELRELGGLEHIIKTITECYRQIDSSNISLNGWDELLLDILRKVDRCLRVLENVTHMNEENQIYLLNYNDSILVMTLASFYNFCGQQILKYPTDDISDKNSNGAVIRECLFAVVKVLINLTHHFNSLSFGGKTVGCQNGVIDNSLHLILQVPQSLPEEKRFDIMMLALILLINMMQQCEENKKLLIGSKSFSINQGEENGLDALITLFYKQEELARAEEQKTDAILDGKKDVEQSETVATTSKSQEEFIEETVAKLLQKAGRHMEHTLIGAYVVLLLGYLIMNNKVYENLVRSRLPDYTFTTMIAVLQKFFNFMNLTASNEISSCGIAATEKVIEFLKMSDSTPKEDKTDLNFALNNKNIKTNTSMS